ncbi:hypothetical protein As57867_003879, partial [Aphanomyces stellatus]
MKQMLRDVGVGHVKVGAVQTDGSWFGGWKLAQECDIMGVNIHPFFGGSPSDPFGALVDRWNSVHSWYGDKLVLAEIGWPTDGGTSDGHVPSMDMALKLFNQVNAAVKRGMFGDLPAYFMFHDNPNKVDFEKSFGLAWANAQWKFDFSALNP